MNSNSMKLCKFFSFIVLLVSQQIFSQNTVEGKIQNQDKEVVPFANVILLNAQDSVSVYKGTVSEDDGSFLLEDIEDNSYLLKISYVGYEDLLKKITVKRNLDINLITLKSDEGALDEVTVNARNPKVRREADRLVFEVENTSVSNNNSFEILKRTPGVIVSQGSLLVKNRAATVYINDRKVYLTSGELRQLLEGFSGVNIKSVEVITNPPARYDAEGGAILNIKTSKTISIGYKGSINASNTQAVVPKYTLGTSHYYKTDWLNAFASYSYTIGDHFKEDFYEIEYFDAAGGTDSYWETYFRRNTNENSHNFNTILDFTLSEKSSLSISANLLQTPERDSRITGFTEVYDANRILESRYDTRSALEEDGDNLLLNATFNTSLGNNGATLSASGNYIDYSKGSTQDLLTVFDNDPEIQDFFTIFGNQRSEIYTGQLDITAPIGSINFETGFKYSGLYTGNFQEINGDQDNLTGTLSDELDFEENIYAGYVSISRDWEHLSFKAGLRGEYTDTYGVSEQNGEVNNNDYFNLFPTAYLMYSTSEDHSFSLDFSRRITRPRFQSLNTFRYFINQNNYTQGNPTLRPAISNKINFNYTFKGKLSFDLYWDRYENALATLPFQDNVNNNLYTIAQNLPMEQQYSLDISYYSYLKDWWYLSLYSSVFFMENTFPALESNVDEWDNDVLSTYIQAYNYISLTKDRTFSTEITGTFFPGAIFGSYQYDETQYSFNIGLRKTFFDSRLVATVNAEDIFNTMNVPFRSQYLNQNNWYFPIPESRRITFGLTYKFGNFKLSDNKRAINAEESVRLKEQTIE